MMPAAASADRGPENLSRAEPCSGSSLAARDLAVEEFTCAAARVNVLGDLLITRELEQFAFPPARGFQAAIAEAAAGIHRGAQPPDGDATPSADDRAVTRQLVDAAGCWTCRVYDHVIVGRRSVRELRRAGLL